MKRHIFLIGTILAAAVSLPLSAQNLTPDVVITNEFEGKVLEASKEAFSPSVPDSVLRFDWDFGYTVFESPYHGSYKFSPYEIQVTKSPSEHQMKRFFLKAGAGYTFHPELYFCFNPDLSGCFSCGIENDFHGYSGPYVGVADRFHGYDMSERIGFSSLVDTKRHILSFGADYGFIAAVDTIQSRFLQTINVNAGMRSNLGPNSTSRYSGDVWAQFYSDRIDGGRNPLTPLIGGSINYDYIFSDKSVLGFDVAAKVVAGKSSPALFRVHPSYSMKIRDFELDLGLRADLVANMGRNWPLFPDIRLRKSLVKDKLYGTVSVTGGNELMGVSDIISLSHHTTAVSDMVQTEGVRAQVEFDGRLLESLQYKIGGGFVYYSRGILEAVPTLASGIEYMSSESYSETYLKATLKWVSSKVEASENLRLSAYSSLDGMAPSPFESDGHLDVFFSRRFNAGADLATAVKRSGFCTVSGESLTIPGYVDLDLRAQYRITGSLAAWFKAGNLLAQPVRRSLLYAEPSFNLMAGIVLNIR